MTILCVLLCLTQVFAELDVLKFANRLFGPTAAVLVDVCTWRALLIKECY